MLNANDLIIFLVQWFVLFFSICARDCASFQFVCCEQVVTAKVHTNAPTSWFVENVPRLLKDKPASEEIDRAILYCKEMIYVCKRIIIIYYLFRQAQRSSRCGENFGRCDNAFAWYKKHYKALSRITMHFNSIVNAHRHLADSTSRDCGRC